MKQVIYKDKRIYCVTTVPYPPHIIKSMKKAGYKVKEIADDEDETAAIKRSKSNSNK